MFYVSVIVSFAHIRNTQKKKGPTHPPTGYLFFLFLYPLLILYFRLTTHIRTRIFVSVGVRHIYVLVIQQVFG